MKQVADIFHTPGPDQNDPNGCMTGTQMNMTCTLATLIRKICSLEPDSLGLCSRCKGILTANRVQQTYALGRRIAIRVHPRSSEIPLMSSQRALQVSRPQTGVPELAGAERRSPPDAMAGMRSKVDVLKFTCTRSRKSMKGKHDSDLHVKFLVFSGSLT